MKVEGIWYVAGVEDPSVLATAREIPFDKALSRWAIEQQQTASIQCPEDAGFCTLRCDIASVATPDAETKNLLSYAIDFPDSRGFLREGNVIPIEGSVLGQVFKTRKLVELAVPNIPVDPATAKGVAEDIKSACIYPLINRDRTLGVTTVGRREDDAFSRDEIGLLCQVAHQLAIALDNAMAYRRSPS